MMKQAVVPVEPEPDWRTTEKRPEARAKLLRPPDHEGKWTFSV
jgi:hypothetical protein